MILAAVQIELVNNTPPWQPWLPVFASSIIGAVTLVVMSRTLRSNRTIELDKWRRDVLSTSLIDATQLSTWCEAKLSARSVWDTSTQATLIGEARQLEAKTTELAAVITQLHLIRAHDAAYATRRLRNAIHDAIGPVVAHPASPSTKQQAQFSAVLGFIREAQSTVIEAGQRELGGSAKSGDAAETHYDSMPKLSTVLKD